MEIFKKPPQWLVDALPESAADLLKGWLWLVVLGFAALVVLLLIWAVGSKLWGMLFGPRVETAKKKRAQADLEETFADYPPLPPSKGDRQLLIENVPVRLRLVVVAPAGTESDIDPETIDKLLERVLPGLGSICQRDKPRVRIWPVQISYEGFARSFHRNTIVPEEEGEMSKWATIAGRAKLGKFQVMLGLGLQAIKPNTVGRVTIKAHEWPAVLRVKVRD